MSIDNDEEYFIKLKSYTLSELVEIEGSIDKERYSSRYLKVVSEIESRKNGIGPVPVSIMPTKRAPQSGPKPINSLYKIRAVSSLIVSIGLIYYGFTLILEPNIERKDIVSVTGKIEVAYLDSTDLHSRIIFKDSYRKFVTIKFENNESKYFYSQSSPNYMKVQEHLLSGGQYTISYARDNEYGAMVPVEVIKGKDTLTSIQNYIHKRNKVGWLTVLFASIVFAFSVWYFINVFRINLNIIQNDNFDPKEYL